MKKKDFWLHHPAIGYYRPTTPDPITGEARIQMLEVYEKGKEPYSIITPGEVREEKQ